MPNTMIKKQFNKRAKPAGGFRPDMADRFLDEVEAGREPYVARMLSKHPSLVHAVRIYDQHDNYVEKSALHIAAMEDRARIVQLLLEAGAPADTQDAEGETALMDAATNNSHNAMKVLIHAGANVSQRGQKGMTPLIRAARNNSHECAKLLLRAGARINTPDNTGETPLHAAVYGAIEIEDQPDERKMLRLLLEKGANADITDGNCMTPADTARSEGKRELANFIEDYAEQVVEMKALDESQREQKALNVLREGSIRPITARKPIQFKRQ